MEDESGVENRERQRTDDSSNIASPLRKLDSFAELCEVYSGSTCIAACVLEGRLIIASNDLCSASRGRGNNPKTAQEVAIEEIYNYFSEIAKTAQIPDDARRRAMFKKICEKAKYQSTATPFYDILDASIAEKLIDAVMDPKATKSKRFFSKKIKGTELSAAKGNWLDLYSSFEKLEKTLSQSTDTHLDETTRQYCSALKKPPIILKTEDEPGVHAEMQILGELFRRQERATLNPSDSENYLGIGKLCCLKCRVMLTVANEENKGGFSVKVRGRHDLKVDGWKSPKASKGGILEKVIKRAEFEVERILMMTKSFKSDMRHDTSDPSFGSDSPLLSQGASSIVDLLRDPVLSVRQKLASSGWPTERIDTILPIMLDLLKITEFSNLFKVKDDHLDQLALRTTLQTMLVKLQAKRPEFTEENLLEIIQNPDVVGAEVAGSFSMLKDSSTSPAAEFSDRLFSLTTAFEDAQQGGGVVVGAHTMTPQADVSASHASIHPEDSPTESDRKKRKIETPKPASPTHK